MNFIRQTVQASLNRLTKCQQQQSALLCQLSTSSAAGNKSTGISSILPSPSYLNNVGLGGSSSLLCGQSFASRLCGVLLGPAITASQQQQVRLKFTKPRKLHPSLRQGTGNGGIEYGVEVEQAHRKGLHRKEKKKVNPLGPNKPFAKGIVLKTLVKKPKKPNSANRKCVLVRLPGGKELTAYIPGEGHNLQEHNQVLVKVARLRDTPGVRIKCVRGKYDLLHVAKKAAAA